MIKQGEAIGQSGEVLSANELNALAAADTAVTSNLSYSAIIEQYGPDWAFHDDIVTQALYLDCVRAGDYLIRMYWDTTWKIERLAVEGESISAWQALTVPSGFNRASGLISLVSSGTHVRVFSYHEDIIAALDCPDVSVTSPEFMPTSLAHSLSGVVALAAVSTSKVYLSYLTSQSNHRMAVLEYGTSWTRTDSDIYWPFPFDSLDAVTLGDRDVVAFSGDLPPLWGTRAIGTTVKSEFNRVQGIVIFTVRNGRWSDYRTFDVVDRDVYGYSRMQLRLSAANGFAFMTYNRYLIFRKADDTGAIISTGNSKRMAPVVSRSRNGVDWEFPEVVLKPTLPFIVLPLGDYLYAVGRKTYRSHACSWAGMTPRRQDVTDYVLNVDSTAGDIRSTTAEFANPYVAASPLPKTALSGTLIDLDLRLTLKLYLGYFADVSTPFVLDESLLDSTDTYLL